MKMKLAVAVALAQVGVLAFMAGQREWVARTGRVVTLRTAPIDPNDPMRGEYVKLNYEMSVVPRSLCRDGVTAWLDDKRTATPYLDRRVYATLDVDANGFAELTGLSDLQPKGGTYVRGRVDSSVWQSNGSIRVRYGIEALFVEEGAAKKLEDQRRGEKAGVPMDVDVALDPGGLAVVKGYHWEPLGLVLTTERPPPVRRTVPAGPRPGIQGATLVLKNHSDRPVSIMTSSFRLINNRLRGEGHFRWVGEDAARSAVAPSDLRLLQPGEEFRVHLDFSRPEWSVTDTNKKGDERLPVALGALANAWDASFRIEYAPPPAAECTSLPDAGLIWHGRLPSRAFNPSGGVD